jgi:hypothetical protein
MAVVGYRKQIGVSNAYIFTEHDFVCQTVDDEFKGLRIVEASFDPFKTGTPQCPLDSSGQSFPAGVINCGGPGVAPGSFRGVYCSQVDRGYCPTFGAPPLDARFARKALGDPYNGPWVRCQYNPQDINTPEHIETWINVFGRDNTWYNQIMPIFCARSSASCPNNPIGGSKTNSCPMLRSVGAGGDLCRQWEQEMLRRGGDSKTIYYNTVNSLCSSNTGAGYFSCGCINRNKDPDFVTLQNLLSQSIGIPSPYCYYIPCSSNQYYIIPQDVADYVASTNTKGTSPCPSDFCLSITKIVANGNVSFTPQGESNISCNFPGSTNNQKISFFSIPPNATSVLEEDDTLSIIIIWVFIIILLLVLILAIWYFLFRR